MLVADSLIGNLIELVVALLVILIGYFKWSYQYWRRRNIPYLEPTIPYGNTTNPFRRTESIAMEMKRNYDRMKANGWKHGGIYSITRPTYVLVDLDYVKNIMTKDFQYFVDRGMYYNENIDPLSANLFAIGGEKWKNLRVKLTPTFTSGKMKMMFQTLLDCEAGLQKKIEEDCKKSAPIDIKEALGCYTTDVIGSCAFGLDFKTFEQENSPFRKYGRKVLASTRLRILKLIFVNSFPGVAKALSVKSIPHDISEFFMKVVKDTVNHREKNNYTRKDFIQLLIDLKNNKFAEEEGYKHDGKTLTFEEIAAQSFVFFIAGFDTSSATMTFALYELAKNQDIQQKLRDEINKVLAKHDGKVTYDAIQNMHYMDQVINESLRKYPPVPFLIRKCVKNYKVPDEDVIIEKGTRIIISIFGIQRDKEYFPDPEKFDPERFSEEGKRSRHPYAHLPFGEGPRMCIGMRFGLMQSKAGLTALLRNFNFTVSKKTKEPLKMKVHSLVLAAEEEIWLDAQKI